MLLPVIIIAVLFALLIGLACVVVMGDRRRRKNGCVGCPYRNRCEGKEYDEDFGDDNEYMVF